MGRNKEVRKLRVNVFEHHTESSSYREKLIEFLFVGELLSYFWQKGKYDAEFIRSEVDNGGYDLVIKCNFVLRHI